jgi:hypothetical protein
MKAYKMLKAAAEQRATESLVESLQLIEADRPALVASRDYELLQSHNMIASSIIEVLIERQPALDAAIDVWCEDLDAPKQTMAAFVVGFMQEVTA